MKNRYQISLIVCSHPNVLYKPTSLFQRCYLLKLLRLSTTEHSIHAPKTTPSQIDSYTGYDGRCSCHFLSKCTADNQEEYCLWSYFEKKRLLVKFFGGLLNNILTCKGVRGSAYQSNLMKMLG